ncbi:MAG: Bug family tripartite tricarboxylate transporter substrate binding protein, partial [Alphaproteobacteria bacterium]
GGYDRYARLTARYMQKYIPGKPTLISKNKTGGGSIVATNYLYNAAPQDGTFIGAVQRGVPVEPLINGKDSKAQFEPLKFNWIGSANRETSIAIAWHTSGIKTYKDLYT